MSTALFPSELIIIMIQWPRMSNDSPTVPLSLLSPFFAKISPNLAKILSSSDAQFHFYGTLTAMAG